MRQPMQHRESLTDGVSARRQPLVRQRLPRREERNGVTVDAPGFGDWLEPGDRPWPEVVAARARHQGDELDWPLTRPLYTMDGADEATRLETLLAPETADAMRRATSSAAEIKVPYRPTHLMEAPAWLSVA